MFQFHAKIAFWILLISAFAFIGGVAAGYSLFLYLKKRIPGRKKQRREQRTLSTIREDEERKEYDYYYIMEKQTR